MPSEVKQLEAKVSQYQRNAEATSKDLGVKYADMTKATTYWGEETVRALDGIRDETATSSYYLSKVAITMGTAFEIMFELLAYQIEQFDQLIELVANPSSTRAKESRARGVKALGNHHLPEAIRDLTEAVGEDPYDVKAYYSLAVAFALTGELEKAGDSFSAAARYASPHKENPSLAAASALLGANCYDKSGHQEQGWKLLHDTWNATQCPDLAIPLAVRSIMNFDNIKEADSFARSVLVKAFTVDGTLVLEATMQEAPQLELAAKEAMRQRYDGELARLKSCLINLRTCYKDLEFELPANYSPPKPLPLNQRGASKSLAAAAVRHAELRHSIYVLSLKLGEVVNRKVAAPQLEKRPDWWPVSPIAVPIVVTLGLIGGQVFQSSILPRMEPDYYVTMMWLLLIGTFCAWVWGIFYAIIYSEQKTKYKKSRIERTEAMRDARWHEAHEDQLRTLLAEAIQVLETSKSRNLPRAFETIPLGDE